MSVSHVSLLLTEYFHNNVSLPSTFSFFLSIHFFSNISLSLFLFSLRFNFVLIICCYFHLISSFSLSLSLSLLLFHLILSFSHLFNSSVFPPNPFRHRIPILNPHLLLHLFFHSIHIFLARFCPCLAPALALALAPFFSFSIAIIQHQTTAFRIGSVQFRFGSETYPGK